MTGRVRVARRINQPGGGKTRNGYFFIVWQAGPRGAEELPGAAGGVPGDESRQGDRWATVLRGPADRVSWTLTAALDAA
jgi:hypothetical protein